MKQGDLFILEVELSFPPDNRLGKSTHVLRSTQPAPLELVQRMQAYFEHHGVQSKLYRAGGGEVG